MAICWGIRGEVSEVRRSGTELHLDWRIPGFLDLHCGDWDFYDSPRFGFYDARWHLRVLPNTGTYGWVYFFLRREVDDGVPFTRRVIFSLGERGSDGGVRWRREEEEQEFEKDDGSYKAYICPIWDLRVQKERVLPGGALTIVCQMRVPGTAATGASSSSCPDVPFRTDPQTGQSNTRTCPSMDRQGASSSSCPDVPFRTDTQTGQSNTRTCPSMDKQGQHESSDECDICCEAPVDCALNPCGHMIWCHQCALRFWEADSPRCPMCRKSIQTILKIYRK